ncbi:TraB/GumN family protein [Candidatus Woesearchaeota archaeon]|nr:TraB/GumN family protein [Candidatus Woesearchaeota archaeon]
MRYKNLIIVGTSHISRESIKAVTRIIEVERPDIIAVELDKKRFLGLLAKGKPKVSFARLRKVGMKGYVFGLLGSYVQRRLGKYVGVSPGTDMLTAIELAQNYGIQLALIDQDIDVTLRKFSQAFTAREKWRLVVDVVKSFFFRQQEMKKLGIEEIDLSRVPPRRLIKKLIENVRERYPNLYRVLITERNQYMARKLYELIELNPGKKIVAVVGAGHEDELVNLVRRIEDHQVEFLV